MAREDTLHGNDAKPRILSGKEHNITPQAVSDNARKVLRRLHAGGYQAYLVGGGVRDLLLGCRPKDFDVATDAHPTQVRGLFRNCLLIGHRFRLAHVRFGRGGGKREIIEVSTFRAGRHVEDSDTRVHRRGRILQDNCYGAIDDDVWRRDFTVNALFYDVRNSSVLDYVGGVRDLRRRQLRLIGSPRKRYIEDPVRLLRAVRFAAKLGFTIHPDSEKPLAGLGHLLQDISPSRLSEEIMKMFMGGAARASYQELCRHNLFRYLFPQTAEILEQDGDGVFIDNALDNTDRRLAAGQKVAPGFLVASLLWLPVRQLQEQRCAAGANGHSALDEAAGEVMARQIASVSFPRRANTMARAIWDLQYRLERRRKVEDRNLRAAYDFIQLRQQSGEDCQAILERHRSAYDAAATSTASTTGRGSGDGPRRRARRRRAPNPDTGR